MLCLELTNLWYSHLIFFVHWFDIVINWYIDAFSIWYPMLTYLLIKIMNLFLPWCFKLEMFPIGSNNWVCGFWLVVIFGVSYGAFWGVWLCCRKQITRNRSAEFIALLHLQFPLFVCLLYAWCLLSYLPDIIAS